MSEIREIQIDGKTVKVRTTHVYPPIPLRQFDWSAVDDDTYDGAPDSHCPVGFGRTEADAIADLLASLRDARGVAREQLTDE